MIFMDLIQNPVAVSLREHDCSMDGSNQEANSGLTSLAGLAI
jgi:hypothetical protein